MTSFSFKMTTTEYARGRCARTGRLEGAMALIVDAQNGPKDVAVRALEKLRHVIAKASPIN